MTLAVVVEVFLCGLLPFGTLCLLLSVLPLDVSPRLLQLARDLPVFGAAVLGSMVYVCGAVTFPILHWLTRTRVEGSWLARKLRVERLICRVYGSGGLDHDAQLENVLYVLEHGRPGTFRVIDHGGALSVVLKGVVVWLPLFAVAYALRLRITDRPLTQLVSWVALAAIAWAVCLFAHKVYGDRQARHFRQARRFIETKAREGTPHGCG